MVIQPGSYGRIQRFISVTRHCEDRIEGGVQMLTEGPKEPFLSVGLPTVMDPLDFLRDLLNTSEVGVVLSGIELRDVFSYGLYLCD